MVTCVGTAKPTTVSMRAMTALASPTLSLLAVFTATPVAASRDSVSFDFGWKHRTGLHDWAPAGSEPPKHPDPGLRPPESAAKFDDAGWADVQLPHDGLIANNSYSDAACPNGCSGHSFIPRRVLWYRKEFTLPSSWKGSAVWLDFEGSFRNTTVWINGALAAQHDCGYTPFRVRLDNLTSVAYGAKSTVAVYVDPDNGDLGGRESGSGWWYEGGGLYRPVHLVRASPVHIEQDGLFAYSNVSLANAGDAASATVHASAAVVNTGGAATANALGVVASNGRGAAAHENVCRAMRRDAAALALLPGVSGGDHAADVARDAAGAPLALADLEDVSGRRGAASFRAPEREAARGALSGACRLRLAWDDGSRSSVFYKRVVMAELPAALAKEKAQPAKLLRDVESFRAVLPQIDTKQAGGQMFHVFVFGLSLLSHRVAEIKRLDLGNLSPSTKGTSTSQMYATPPPTNAAVA